MSRGASYHAHADEDENRTMMEYKGYLGRADIDGEELSGTVVNLHRDHMDLLGRTIEEVRRAFHDSDDFYLEGCRQEGEAPGRPASGMSSWRRGGSPHAHEPTTRGRERPAVTPSRRRTQCSDVPLGYRMAFYSP